MIGNLALQSQTVSTAIGQVEMNLGKAAARSGCQGVADQHMRIVSSGSIEGRPVNE